MHFTNSVFRLPVKTLEMILIGSRVRRLRPSKPLRVGSKNWGADMNGSMKNSAGLPPNLIGLPFAFKVGKRGSLYGIGVALILVLVYWAAYAMFNALGLEAILPATVAAWAPNVLFGLLGTYLMLYVRT